MTSSRICALNQGQDMTRNNLFGPRNNTQNIATTAHFTADGPGFYTRTRPTHTTAQNCGDSNYFTPHMAWFTRNYRINRHILKQDYAQQGALPAKFKKAKIIYISSKAGGEVHNWKCTHDLYNQKSVGQVFSWTTGRWQLEFSAIGCRSHQHEGMPCALRWTFRSHLRRTLWHNRPSPAGNRHNIWYTAKHGGGVFRRLYLHKTQCNCTPRNISSWGVETEVSQVWKK